MKYLVIGIACFIIAIIFGSQSTVEVSVGYGQSVSHHSKGQNTTAAGASLGFAIAGGMCILASAIDKKK